MAHTRMPIVIGNWKMNGFQASVTEVEDLKSRIAGTAPRCEVMVCPPATLLIGFAELTKDTPIMIGAQDCHMAENGAHTGDISASMIADCGASAVILGHSERRMDHGESDAIVRDKLIAAHKAGLGVILCIGESETQRDSGKTLEVLSRQIAGSLPPGAVNGDLIVAYEPVWAIGTGRTPTLEQVGEAHRHIRAELERHQGTPDIRILYGGSVKPGNAKEIFAVEDVDGGLIGGASLKASDFHAIIEAV